MSKRATLIVIDFLLLFAAFCIINLIRLRSVGSAIEAYKLSFLVFAAIWIAVSLSFGKYGTEGTDFQPKFKKIIVSNLVALAIATWLMFLFYFYNLSRVVVFGTIGIATLLEIMMLGTWYLVKQSKILPEEKIKKKKLKPIEELHVEVDTSRTISDERRKAVKRAIINELGENVYKYFNTNLNLSLESTLIISTTTVFNIDNQPSNFFHTIANLKRVNDIRWINKFFESVNAKLPKGGFFVCMAETKNLRTKDSKKISSCYQLHRLLHRLHHKTDTPKIHVNKRYLLLSNTRAKSCYHPCRSFGQTLLVWLRSG